MAFAICICSIYLLLLVVWFFQAYNEWTNIDMGYGQVVCGVRRIIITLRFDLTSLESGLWLVFGRSVLLTVGTLLLYQLTCNTGSSIRFFFIQLCIFNECEQVAYLVANVCYLLRLYLYIKMVYDCIEHYTFLFCYSAILLHYKTSIST